LTYISIFVILVPAKKIERFIPDFHSLKKKDRTGTKKGTKVVIGYWLMVKDDE
jgi:hypothetical protein